MAVVNPKRQCGGLKPLRHGGIRIAAGRAALMLSCVALLATDARRRPSEVVAQAQLEATLIRAVFL